MIEQIGIGRFLTAASVGCILAVIVGLTDAGALAAYGAVLGALVVFIALYHRADRRGEIDWSK